VSRTFENFTLKEFAVPLGSPAGLQSINIGESQMNGQPVMRSLPQPRDLAFGIRQFFTLAQAVLAI
jgi:hypothetical protein